ncbi:CHASE3 domain-containing protein [Aureimonas altamirensis]|uniref:sensor histidine kinase n=1 Tax=Aureimonas altamirensis TaxID=370622 RepID=UPI001E58C8F5|nr:CHASE3 domain-containing protein [Aureimonas altamirensis]UHD43924.1 CHASE3 domain-containing protein [Aureimonas altamirensis]
MAITQKQFYARTFAFLAAALLLLLTIVGGSLYLTRLTQQNFDKVVMTRSVRSAAADLLSRIIDAETGQRGYLLTRDQRYLEPYREQVGAIAPRVEQLQVAMDQMMGGRVDLSELSQRVTAKTAELDSTVSLALDGQYDAAVAEVAGGAGLALMDEIRSQLGTILDQTEAQLRAGIERQESIGSTLRHVTVVGALAIILMAAAAAWTILRYTREVAEARAEIESANVALEARVEERTTDLIKANEEIQRFAYIVTHDLRAPLVNIMGFTSELEATFAPVRDYMASLPPGEDTLRRQAEEAIEQEVPEAISFIRSSTRKMDALINAILKISREGRRSLKPERVDLRALVETATNSVHHQGAENEGEIETDVKAKSIVTDRLSLDQILGNLLDNAIKYREPSRPLRISVRTRNDSYGRVVIEVEDNGRGISPADNERVFELFRRSGKQDTAGEGIGLAHVRTLARNLGGDIGLKSELGTGSTFTLVLPANLSNVKRSMES